MGKGALPFLIAFLVLFLPACQEKAQNQYAPGEVIIKFKAEAFNDKGELTSQSLMALNTKFGLIRMERLSAHVYNLKFPVRIDARQLAAQYTKNPLVVYAEPNYTIKAQDAD